MMIQQISDIGTKGGDILELSDLYEQHLAEKLKTKRRIRESDLANRRKGNLRQSSREPPKLLNGHPDLEDLAAPSTMKRWEYMKHIQDGVVEIIARHDFKSAGSINVSRDGRWFLIDGSSNYFRELDPISFKKVNAINIISSRNFNPGDYVIRTIHQRVFQGRGTTLQYELDPQTLREMVDEFFHPSTLVGFREARYSGNGYERRSLARILLRQAEDVYAAMIDIANGDANSSDYMTTKATMKWITTLSSIQRKRELHGGHYALHKALDYMFKDMSVPASFEGCTKKAYSIYRNPVSEVIPSQVKYKGRSSPPRYCGDRMLIFDNFAGKLLLPIPILNAISTFSNNRSG